MALGIITTSTIPGFHSNATDPHWSEDDRPMLAELERRGVSFAPVFWEELATAPSLPYSALLMRTPWDYAVSSEKQHRFQETLRHLCSLSIPTLNHPELMLWNLDKHYLGELGSIGIAGVATEFFSDTDLTIDLLRERLAGGSLVIKPVVSAGARNTFLVRSEKDIATFDQQRGAAAHWMVQPFIDSVSTEGEWSLLYFGGQYSHAVCKRPQRGGWLVQEAHGGHFVSEAPAPELIAFANDAVAKLARHCQARGWGEGPLYVRVDVLRAAEGYVIGELELIEPQLFFHTHTPGQQPVANTLAASNFVDALVNKIDPL